MTAADSPAHRWTGLLLVGATFLWSTNYLLAYALQGGFSPVQLTFLRWALGAPLLIAAAFLLERPRLRDIRRDWQWHLVMAATGLILYNLLNYQALHFTGPTNAAIVNSANRVVIALLARMVIGSPLSRRTVAGIVVSLVGVLVVISRGTVATLASMSFNVGELLVLLAVLSWAVYSVVARRLSTGPVTAVATQAVITSAVLAPFVAISGLGEPASAADAVWIALLVLFPTCLAFVLWNVAVARIGAARAGVAINLMPLFTGAMAAIAGLQEFTWSLVLGGALVLTGVVVATAPARPRA